MEEKYSPVDIWDPRIVRKQLCKHTDVASDFAKLDEAIRRLPNPTDPPRPASYEPLLLLLLDESELPAWSAVHNIILDIFVRDGRWTKEALEVGPYGIKALRLAMGRAEPADDQDVGEAKRALYLITAFARDLEQDVEVVSAGSTSAPFENGASAPRSHVSPNRTAPEPSSERSFSELTYRDHSRQPNTLFMQNPIDDDKEGTPFHLFQQLNRNRSVSVQPPFASTSAGGGGGAAERNSKRARSPSPSPRDSVKPRLSISFEQNKASDDEFPRADSPLSILSEEVDERESQVGSQTRRSTRGASSRANYAVDQETDDEEEENVEDETEYENESGTDNDHDGDEGENPDERWGNDFVGEFGGTDVQEEEEEEDVEEPVQSPKKRSKPVVLESEEEDELEGAEVEQQDAVVAEERREPSPNTPSPSPPPPAPAVDPSQMSPEERLVRDVFTSIPADVRLAPPNDFNPSPQDAVTGFTRFDIGGKIQYVINPGTADGGWLRHKNHLCIGTEMNLCGFPFVTPRGAYRPQPFKPGSPIIFVSHAKRLQEVLDAIEPLPDLKKTSSFTHLWIQETTGDQRWRYKGMHEVGYRGDLPGMGEVLPELREDGSKSEIHDELFRRIQAHATSDNAAKKWPEIVLTSWDFAARDWIEAEQEIGTNNSGGRTRHVKYLALRCIGWDKDSWKIWTQAREIRLVKEAKEKKEKEEAAANGGGAAQKGKKNGNKQKRKGKQ